MIREPFPIEEMNKILKRYEKEKVSISEHYLKYVNLGKRDISEEEIFNFLFEKDFYFVEKQINLWIRYKIVYELSHKYDLIIVVKEDLDGEKGKILKVVSVYKTNKKLKEKWKKMSKSLMMR